jgi:hypothetical protein
MRNFMGQGFPLEAARQSEKITRQSKRPVVMPARDRDFSVSVFRAGVRPAVD